MMNNYLESPGFKRQKEIMGEIQNGGHNIVTCGMCGDILLVRTDEEEHQCVFCNVISEPCDFPDFISI